LSFEKLKSLFDLITFLEKKFMRVCFPGILNTRDIARNKVK
jgi:hypothetical protein